MNDEIVFELARASVIDSVDTRVNRLLGDSAKRRQIDPPACRVPAKVVLLFLQLLASEHSSPWNTGQKLQPNALGPRQFQHRAGVSKHNRKRGSASKKSRG